MKQLIPLVLLLGLSIFLPACGGGSSSNTTNVTPPPPPPPAIPCADCSIEAIQAPLVPALSDYAAYISVQGNPLLSGQSALVAGATSALDPLYIDTETGTGACSPTLNYTVLDSVLTPTLLTNILLAPSAEGGTNTYTPECVFSQAQANASALPYT